MFQNVLVGVDGRQGGRDAIALAKQLAPAGARIVLGHVCPLAAGRGAGLAMPLERQDAEEMLAREREATEIQADVMTAFDFPAGRGLQWMAEQVDADVLVVGSSHRGLLGRVFLGDQTSHALDGAPCAVAIAPLGYAPTAHPFTSIGVGYDGSTESELALDAARGLTTGRRVQTKALLAVSLDSIPRGRPIPAHWPEIVVSMVDDGREQLESLDDVEGEVVYGWPAEELARLGREVDLLIVGSRSYGPLGRLLHGSTSSYLARHCHCPLLVLPRSAIQHAQRRQAAEERPSVAAEI